MWTNEGNYVTCACTGKICYTEREAGIVINRCKRHVYLGSNQWGKSGYGNSKDIPRRKYFCRECGYYHLTHMAFYGKGSKNYAWEEFFYRDYENRQKRARA